MIEIKIDLQNIEYEKYIYEDYIDNYLSKANEYPISYIEIEYIEFKKHWKIGKAATNKARYGYDKRDDKKIGQFELKETEEYLRIIGYR